VPLHYYFIQALDQMYAHLTDGDRLPASQLVRTIPRGRSADGSVPQIEVANLPPIKAAPSAADRITFDGQTLRIPE
jgi:hydroxybutyrate-dimer hydrolase